LDNCGVIATKLHHWPHLVADILTFWRQADWWKYLSHDLKPVEQRKFDSIAVAETSKSW
jgi:hypothetical protein